MNKLVSPLAALLAGTRAGASADGPDHRAVFRDFALRLAWIAARRRAAARSAR